MFRALGSGMKREETVLVVGDSSMLTEICASLATLKIAFKQVDTIAEAIVLGDGHECRSVVVDSAKRGSSLKAALAGLAEDVEGAGEPCMFSVLLVCELAHAAQELPLLGDSFDECIVCPVSAAELQVRLQAMAAWRDRAKLLSELRLEVERRNQLAAFIVHDMRNPLSAIVGNVQLLQEFSESDDSMQSQCLGDLGELGDQVMSMVNSLLEVEQMEAGRLSPIFIEVELAPYLGALPARYATALQARKIEMELQLEAGVTARFDKDLILRIVENLLDNSIRYTPRRGRVVIASKVREGDLEITVGNSGPAIPEAEHERIFDRYFRLDNTRDGARVSRGLGLYFCKLAAEAHKGTVKVESRPGFPACFVLHLPQSVVGA
ncbi:MAG: HAMP domain-containing histidine kinase [Kofleriaceae bacterium]|nr:HAMP domain-containing histidine kinase [Kofleriaceae bacterium]